MPLVIKPATYNLHVIEGVKDDVPFTIWKNAKTGRWTHPLASKRGKGASFRTVKEAQKHAFECLKKRNMIKPDGAAKRHNGVIALTEAQGDLFKFIKGKKIWPLDFLVRRFRGGEMHIRQQIGQINKHYHVHKHTCGYRVMTENEVRRSGNGR